MVMMKSVKSAYEKPMVSVNGSGGVSTAFPAPPFGASHSRVSPAPAARPPRHRFSAARYGRFRVGEVASAGSGK